jgi:hypothetical protein
MEGMSEKELLDAATISANDTAIRMTVLKEIMPHVERVLGEARIKLVVQLLMTDSFFENALLATTRCTSQFAATDNVWGAGAIVSTCAAGPSCMALVLPARAEVDIFDVVSRIIHHTTAQLLIIIHTHPRGLVPHNIIPVSVASAHLTRKDFTATCPSIDTDVTLFTVAVGPRLCEAVISSDTTFSPPPRRRQASCPRLLP